MIVDEIKSMIGDIILLYEKEKYKVMLKKIQIFCIYSFQIDQKFTLRRSLTVELQQLFNE